MASTQSVITPNEETRPQTPPVVGANGYPGTVEDMEKEIARLNEKWQLAEEQHFLEVKDPKPYWGNGRRECENFISQCQVTFYLKSITYEKDAAKLFYGQSFLRGDIASKWDIERPQLDAAALTWEYFADFLQKKLKFDRLEVVKVAAALNEMKQKPGQTVRSLVLYMNRLEDRLPERNPEFWRHMTLMRALHEYIRRDVLRYCREGTTVQELAEAADSMESIEPWHDFIRRSKEENVYRRGRNPVRVRVFISRSNHPRLTLHRHRSWLRENANDRCPTRANARKFANSPS